MNSGEAKRPWSTRLVNTTNPTRYRIKWRHWKPAHEGAETAPLPRFPLFDSGDPALGEELDRELGSKSKDAETTEPKTP